MAVPPVEVMTTGPYSDRFCALWQGGPAVHRVQKNMTQKGTLMSRSMAWMMETNIQSLAGVAHNDGQGGILG